MRTPESLAGGHPLPREPEGSRVTKKSRASQRAVSRRPGAQPPATPSPSTPASAGGFRTDAASTIDVPARPPAGGASNAAAAAAGSGSVARPTAARRSRPARVSRDTRPFLERHRLAIVGVGVLAIVVAVSGFVFFEATQPLYACSSIFNDPAATSPSGAPQTDHGKTHITPGSFQAYDVCPPASGPHNNTSQFGPIAARYYAPDEQTVPQGWVHNLEHGALVVLYRCSGDECGDATQNQLKQFVATMPNSPVCNAKPGGVSPVVTKFDQLPHPYAAIVWDRVMYLDTFDPARILAFYKQYGEKVNPEPQCPRPSASPAVSASPAASVDASASPSGVASPSPS
jgi:hypothetical protein